MIDEKEAHKKIIGLYKSTEKENIFFVKNYCHSSQHKNLKLKWDSLYNAVDIKNKV